ncbi:MAG: DNA repair exonuclease [Thermoanaerobaculia bacterium]
MLKLLVTGDLHLGRRASRLPDELADDPRFSATAVWTALVERALTEDVAAVLLTGDVVDRDNRFFEALGPLLSGLSRLAAASIPAFAVAGNHDFDVLPRLAAQLPAGALRLLGRGGSWELATLEREGRPCLGLAGWSFPRERFPGDPLEGFPAAELQAARGGLTWLGLLHSEVGVAASPYAPTAAERLRAQGVEAWLLGHVHSAGALPGEGPRLLYPGSPLALDFREPGVHGALLVELEGERLLGWRQIPLSPTRYEEFELSLPAGAEEEGQVAAVNRRLGALLEEAETQGEEALLCLGVRLKLAGKRAGDLGALFADLADLRLPGRAATLFVDRWRDATHAAPDLAALATGSHPPARLARLLLALEAGGEEALVAAAGQKLELVQAAPAYAGLARGPAPGPDAARGHLRRAGEELLARLLAQKEPG